MRILGEETILVTLCGAEQSARAFVLALILMWFPMVKTPPAFAEEGGQRRSSLPTIPYGAVYFRKSNPPQADWERDYRQAAKDGMNAFRHWFLWSAIEVAPGEYDWEDYDRQLDLAAKHGIKTIIADILCTAPEWAFKKYPHARIEEADGTKRASHYTIACAVGGWPGLCLDNEEVRAHAEQFLRAMVKRYRNHPGTGGYDVWNELNHFGDAGGCYCEASAKKFRLWLKDKYGNIDALNKAWYRYSYTGWDDVEIPRTNDPYPDSIDWMQFRIDNAVRLLKWRIGIIRSLDSKHPVTAHCIPMGAMKSIGPDTYPVFQAGKLIDIYGYSGGCNHEEWTNLRWQHWCKMDMTRSASYGKPFWAAEMPAGASWRMRGGRDLDEGRFVTPADVRFYSMMNFAGGARGVFSPRWRPLLDGPLAGCFAFYDMDGSPNDRSEMAGQIAQWANRSGQESMWRAQPAKGDIGILLVPESQIHCYASQDSTAFYYQCIRGAYQAFLFNNIQPDFVHIDDLGFDNDLLYLPYPVMLTERTAEKLESWVGQGGKLICEGCPAYYGDRGRAGEHQPNYGLDRLFGAKQQWVQFTPDLLDDLTIRFEDGTSAHGGIYLQSYTLTTGKAVGTYADGRIAAVDNTFGKGKTRLIGTFPGYGYNRSQDSDTKRFFANLLKWADKDQHVTSSDSRIIARLHTDASSRFLWIVNSDRQDISTKLELSDRWGSYEKCRLVAGGAEPTVRNRVISVGVPARTVLVLELL